MYELYGDSGSGAFCIEAMLAQAKAEYHWNEISLTENGQHSTDFLALNPVGKIPALVLENGDVLTESAAIVLWLAEMYPEAALLPPPGAPDRAKALRLMMFMATEIYPMIEIHDYPERFSETDAASLRDTASKRIIQRMELLEKHIAGPWILESGFSAVDLYLTMFACWRPCRDRSVAHLPKIDVIVRAVAAHPVVGPICVRHHLTRT